MKHGPHHQCLMCSMAKTVGMMEKHPEGCNCQSHPKKQDEKKNEGKVNADIGL